MRLFTERRFKEELERRMHEAEEAEYIRRRLVDLEERIEKLRMAVEELRYRPPSERKEE